MGFSSGVGCCAVCLSVVVRCGAVVLCASERERATYIVLNPSLPFLQLDQFKLL